jgi:hypothetical protein
MPKADRTNPVGYVQAPLGHRGSQTFSEVVERNGRMNVTRSVYTAIRVGEAGADEEKCGINAELNDESQE